MKKIKLLVILLIIVLSSNFLQAQNNYWGVYGGLSIPVYAFADYGNGEKSYKGTAMATNGYNVGLQGHLGLNNWLGLTARLGYQVNPIGIDKTIIYYSRNYFFNSQVAARTGEYRAPYALIGKQLTFNFNRMKFYLSGNLGATLATSTGFTLFVDNNWTSRQEKTTDLGFAGMVALGTFFDGKKMNLGIETNLLTSYHEFTAVWVGTSPATTTIERRFFTFNLLVSISLK